MGDRWGGPRGPWLHAIHKPWPGLPISVTGGSETGSQLSSSEPAASLSAFARGLPPPPRQAPSGGRPRESRRLRLGAACLGALGPRASPRHLLGTYCGPGTGRLCRHVSPSAPSELCDFVLTSLGLALLTCPVEGRKEVRCCVQSASHGARHVARGPETLATVVVISASVDAAACPLPVFTRPAPVRAAPAPTAPVRAEPSAPFPGLCPAPSRRTGPRVP